MTAHKPGQLNTGAAGAPSTSPVPQARPQPGRYEIDTTCSAVTFRTRHMLLAMRPPLLPIADTYPT